MKIKSIKISDPLVRFDSVVTHYTPRKSTVIEWAILEAIKKAQGSLQWSNIPASTLFEKILGIPDVDLLVAPCLKELMDINAIQINNFHDSTPLNEVQVKDIVMTSSGIDMQLKGLLPGREKEDFLEVFYNPNTGQLENITEFVQKSLKDEPTEIATLSIDDEDDFEYPYSMIRDKIQNQSSREIRWIQSNTEIRDIQEYERDLLWRITSKNIHLVKDGQFIIEDDQSSIISENVFKAFVDKNNIGLPIHLYNRFAINKISDVDTEFKALLEIPDLKNLLTEINTNTSSICFQDKEILDAFGFPYDMKISSGGQRIQVLFNCKKNCVEYSGGAGVRLEITEKFPYEEYVVLNEKHSVGMGYFQIYSNESKECVFLGYEKTCINAIQLIKLLEEVIYNHRDVNEFLPVLLRLRKNPTLMQILEDRISSESDLASYIELLKYITDVAVQNLGIKKNEFNFNSLLSKANKQFILDRIDASTLNGIDMMLNEIAEYPLLSKSETVSQETVKHILQTVNSIQKYSDVVELLKDKFTQKLNISKSWLRDNVPVNRIYSEDILKELFSSLADSENNIPEFSVVEISFNKLRKVFFALKKKLPDIDLTGVINEEQVFNYLDSLVHEHENLKTHCNNWTTTLDKLAPSTGKVEDISGCVIRDITENVMLLKKVLAKFLSDNALEYKQVYVFDTCALIDHPDLLSVFSEEDLVVVPTVVIEELDGLKEEPEKSKNARIAIKNINKALNKKKILVEEGSKELILEGLDENVRDNLILSVAMKYRSKSATVITNDYNLANKSMAATLIAKTSLEIANSKVGKKNKKNK